MPWAPCALQELWIDSLTVISNSKLEPPRGIVKLHLDTARLGMPVGVSQRFARNSTNLIGYEWLQAARRALDLHRQGNRTGVGRVIRKLLSERPQRFDEIRGLDGRGPQSLHRVPPLSNRGSTEAQFPLCPLEVGPRNAIPHEKKS